ncbi:hypothetical protein A1OW_14220 [Enterovibrio norvegicus]|uniref:DUF2169 family type VI secretion system accessory protein n=1 Tax=Enterovibrio norvegicus TaxID=188144 RepID=UPI0002D3AB49|nr:DUF2169 domain-containing protein [Enterovibrio norvegicus]OEF48811.1 hypothetical protein A1OW_14220 [Enterovibrio norvegicus]
MRIIKDLNQGILTAPFSLAGKQYFTVTTTVAFTLGEQNILKDEQEMWNLLGEELGEEILDTGMPKTNGEWLVKGKAHCYESPKEHTRVKSGLAGRSKTLEVHGPRRWQKDEATSASSFRTMAIDWVNAYGHEKCAENPSGNVFQQPAMVNYPGHTQLHRDHEIEPASFLPLYAHHPRRHKQLGTYDKDWFADHWPGYPQDFDLNYFNVAPTDQQLSGWVPEGAEFQLVNLHPTQPVLTGCIPTHTPRAFALHETEDSTLFSEITLNRDTVWFFPSVELGVVIYHGVIEITDDEALDVKTVVLGLEPPGSELLPIEHYLAEANSTPAEQAAKMAGIDPSDNEAASQEASLKELAIQREREKANADNARQRHFEIAQLRGLVPTLTVGIADYGSFMTDMLEGFGEDTSEFLEGLEKQQKQLSEFKQSSLKTLDKQYERLIKEAAGNSQQTNSQATLDAQQKLQAAKEKINNVGKDPEDWNLRASSLLALAELNVSKHWEEYQASGLRSVSAARYMLGYIDKPYPFVAKEWGLDMDESLEIGPGWLLPTYQGDKFVSITVRPSHLSDPNGEYQVPGSRTVNWRSGPEGKNVLIADELFLGWQIAQDIDDSIMVIVAEDATSIQADELAHAESILIPVAAGNNSDQSLLEPWQALHPNVIAWQLPQDCECLDDLIANGHEPREWLQPYVSDEALEPPSIEELIQATYDEHTEGKPPEQFMQEQAEKHLAQTEETLLKQGRFLEDKAPIYAAIEKARAQINAPATPMTYQDMRDVLNNQPSPDTFLPKMKSMKDVPLEDIKLKLAEAKKKQAAFNQEMNQLIDDAEQAEKNVQALEEQAKVIKQKEGMAGRKLTREELEQAYANGESLQALDLTGLDLTKIQLAGADLSKSILIGADLTGSNLANTKMEDIQAEKAKFDECILTESSFNSALIQGASFSKAQCIHCDFSGANLTEASLIGADLTQANFQMSQIDKADLSQSYLMNADFSNVMAFEANFDNAQMKGCIFNKSIFNDASFNHTNLSDSQGERCCLWGVKAESMCMDNADISYLALSEAKLNNASFMHAKLVSLSVIEAEIYNANFQGAILNQAYINESRIIRSNFNLAQIRQGQLRNTDMEGSSFIGANLMKSSLVKSSFSDVDFQGAILFNADVRNINITEGVFKNSNVKRTILEENKSI